MDAAPTSPMPQRPTTDPSDSSDCPSSPISQSAQLAPTLTRAICASQTRDILYSTAVQHCSVKVQRDCVSKHVRVRESF
jgi:hypothetical protein